MNNANFGKTMDNVRKHRDIKLVTTERRKNHFVQNQIITENLLAIEMKKKTEILINMSI